jgi:homoserine dehydrogenase
LPIELINSAYYLRLDVQDKAGVMAAVTSAMANHGISIEAVLQKEPNDVTADNQSITVILLTNKVLEKALLAAKNEIEALDSINAPVVRIRVESL